MMTATLHFSEQQTDRECRHRGIISFPQQRQMTLEMRMCIRNTRDRKPRVFLTKEIRFLGFRFLEVLIYKCRTQNYGPQAQRKVKTNPVRKDSAM